MLILFDAHGQTEEGAIRRGPLGDKKIALLFSGDEFAEGGESILAELNRRHGKASFFFTGHFLAQTNFEPLIRRIVAEGHYLGPHSDKHLLYCSWDKSKKTLVTRAEFESDLEANFAKIEAFGVSRNAMRFFLPSFEQYNQQIADWSAGMGLTLIDYTTGTRANADYTGESEKNFVSSKTIVDSILRKAREDPHGLNGFLLLLHIGSGPGRADKFDRFFGPLLDQLAADGYQFVRVDDLIPEIFIRADQVGYPVNGPNSAIAFSKVPLPRGFALIAENGGIAFQGQCEPVTNVAWGQFQHFAALDFSTVRTPGKFVLKAGQFTSLPFTIANDPYAALHTELLEFMGEQRCGYNPWIEVHCHQLDGRTAYGPRTNGAPIDVTGGWHDAGDMLKYLMTSEEATAQMLLACQLDSRNPAVLDEARWGLEWMLKMHPAPDELYHQVGDDRDHAGWRLPQNDQADYGWGKGSARVAYFADGRPQGLKKYQSESTGVANIAGVYAAAMGLAFQIWHDDQKEFAARCLKAGEEVYELGRAREGVQQGNSYSAPYRYEPTTWAGDMEWGATELFRATGKQPYLDEAKHYAKLAADESWMGREQTAHYQFFPFINLGHFRLYNLVDSSLRKILAGYY